MPLPTALAAKLAKRGILTRTRQQEAHSQSSTAITNQEEEIIAEDYDDSPSGTGGTGEISGKETGAVAISSTARSWMKTIKAAISEHKAAPGCPNKWNVFHECTYYCFEHWGAGIREPNPEDEKKRLKMLKKYPMPKNWEEIYDPGTGRFYYWDTSSGEVSWLPPLHPRSKIALPAAKIRELQKEKENNNPDDVEMTEIPENRLPPVDKNDNKGSQGSERSRSRRWDSTKSRGGKSIEKSNELDPMDPAAYSDTPRGTWSTGLERKGEAKTGADTTASGPLYQMRPYPSPGAVLRANAEMQSRDIPN